MDGEARNPRVDPTVAPLPTMGIAAMGAQRPDPFCGRGQTAKDLADIVGDQLWQIRAPGGEAEWFLNRAHERRDVRS